MGQKKSWTRETTVDLQFPFNSQHWFRLTMTVTSFCNLNQVVLLLTMKMTLLVLLPEQWQQHQKTVM